MRFAGSFCIPVHCISVSAPETERKMELTIGKRIREMRLAAGMSQEQLAEALCTKKCTISAYETDKIDIKSSILKELAAVLHCSASYLLEGNKETEVDGVNVSKKNLPQLDCYKIENCIEKLVK